MVKPAGAIGALIFVGAGVVAASVANADDDGFSFALIGDVPYGSADVAAFPDLIADVNNDVDVELVAHAGDIKSGSTPCGDDVLEARLAAFQTFEDAFWLTPGDNEWTDCLNPTPQEFPLDRLAKVRELFYPDTGQTIGMSPRPVVSQSSGPTYTSFVEHTRFQRSCVTFGSVHQVGSGNGSVPWKNETAQQRINRESEMARRNEAAAAWIDEIFDDAETADSSAVFVLTHARLGDGDAYEEVRERLRARSTAFDGPVVVANGDEHGLVIEAAFLDVANLTRWQTPGGVGAVDSWIKVDVDCSSDDVFAWSQVEVGTTPATTTTTTTTTTVAPAPTPPPTSGPDEPIARSAAASDRAVRLGG